MDVITLAIIGFVAIAGPTILALMLYWRDNPDQRPSWRRALEHSRDTEPEHFPGITYLSGRPGRPARRGGRPAQLPCQACWTMSR